MVNPLLSLYNITNFTGVGYFNNAECLIYVHVIWYTVYNKGNFGCKYFPLTYVLKLLY